MPHSTDDDVVPTPKRIDEDIDLPDALPANSEEACDYGSADVSQDRPMENILPKNDDHKQEIKLEQLFNDDEEDDEACPDSSAPPTDVGSSPPVNQMLIPKGLLIANND